MIENEKLFVALGVVTAHGGEPRYFLRVRGEVRSFRAWQMASLGFLLDIHADVHHWRTIFPRRRNKIDVQAAAGFFIGECQRMGEFNAPENHKPGPVGRPRNDLKATDDVSCLGT